MVKTKVKTYPFMHFNDPRVVRVEMMFFPGIGSHGHYYGKMCSNIVPPGKQSWQYETQEVLRTLTAMDARILTKMEDDRMFPSSTRYKKGDITERFDDRASCGVAAVEQYKKHWPNAIYLLAGNMAYSCPLEILDGPNKDELNNLWATYEHASDTGKPTKSLEDQWDILFSKAFK